MAVSCVRVEGSAVVFVEREIVLELEWKVWITWHRVNGHKHKSLRLDATLEEVLPTNEMPTKNNTDGLRRMLLVRYLPRLLRREAASKQDRLDITPGIDEHIVIAIAGLIVRLSVGSQDALLDKLQVS